MRLQNVTIEGFRAFTERVDISLSSDVTILVGPNGTGKTSLLDAILWGLTGHLGRVGDKQLVSLYAPAGLARVAITMTDGTQNWSLVRTLMNGSSNISFTGYDGTAEGPLADAALVRVLWEAGASSAKPFEDLHEVLTRCVYLQQDLVRQFVDRDTPSERFDAIGRLVGVGRLADFERKLTNQNKAWAAIMNQRKHELVDAEKRLADLRSEQLHLGKHDEGASAAHQWSAWWNDLLDKGLGVRPIPDISVPNAAQLLDRMLQALQSARTSVQRQLSTIPQLREDYVQLSAVAETSEERLEKLQSAVISAKEAVDRLKKACEAAEQRDAAARAKLVAKTNAMEEMRSLAALAIRHLSKHCPVCEQVIDAKAVEARLERLLGGETLTIPGITLETPRVLDELERASANLKKATREFEEVNDADRVLAARKALLRSQLADLEVPEPTLAALDRRAATLADDLANISNAYKSGEELALAMARLSEESKREELARRESEAARGVESARVTFEEYQTAHEQASKIIDSVRAMADDAVNRQIERIGPLLQKIYTRIDPHPTFRWAELRSHGSYGKGRVETGVEDRREDKKIESPALLFSSSQTSALAVAIFMAMNLSSERLPLHIAILDDPLQTLDTINLLGLLDVLRRTRERRQLVISTHDQNFAALLRRKFRPLELGQQTSTVRLRNWERSGVQLDQSIDSEIPARLQVVS